MFVNAAISTPSHPTVSSTTVLLPSTIIFPTTPTFSTITVSTHPPIAGSPPTAPSFLALHSADHGFNDSEIAARTAGSECPSNFFRCDNGRVFGKEKVCKLWKMKIGYVDEEQKGLGQKCCPNGYSCGPMFSSFCAPRTNTVTPPKYYAEPYYTVSLNTSLNLTSTLPDVCTTSKPRISQATIIIIATLVVFIASVAALLWLLKSRFCIPMISPVHGGASGIGENGDLEKQHVKRHKCGNPWVTTTAAPALEKELTGQFRTTQSLIPQSVSSTQGIRFSWRHPSQGQRNKVDAIVASKKNDNIDTEHDPPSLRRLSFVRAPWSGRINSVLNWDKEVKPPQGRSTPQTWLLSKTRFSKFSWRGVDTGSRSMNINADKDLPARPISSFKRSSSYNLTSVFLTKPSTTSTLKLPVQPDHTQTTLSIKPRIRGTPASSTPSALNYPASVNNPLYPAPLSQNCPPLPTSPPPPLSPSSMSLILGLELSLQRTSSQSTIRSHEKPRYTIPAHKKNISASSESLLISFTATNPVAPHCTRKNSPNTTTSRSPCVRRPSSAVLATQGLSTNVRLLSNSRPYRTRKRSRGMVWSELPTPPHSHLYPAIPPVKKCSNGQLVRSETDTDLNPAYPSPSELKLSEFTNILPSSTFGFSRKQEPQAHVRIRNPAVATVGHNSASKTAAIKNMGGMWSESVISEASSQSDETNENSGDIVVKMRDSEIQYGVRDLYYNAGSNVGGLDGHKNLPRVQDGNGWWDSFSAIMEGSE